MATLAQEPEPLQFWQVEQAPSEPAGRSLVRQVPAPLQASAFEQAVAAVLQPMSGTPLATLEQAPAPSQSWQVGQVPSAPAARSLARQAPAPLQVSAFEQAVAAVLQPASAWPLATLAQ